ncbi:gamma-glutamyl hydrolase A-like [Brevipalpus obovatus]|uniref:gamma-glutamyl hydrolase A-like n=1 Tax=Brevipalpus obovatus TaxID=246614 RepID=UPI003D9E146A
MNASIILIISLCYILVACDHHPELNDRPVIGILAVPDSRSKNQIIPSAYVEFVRLGGARVLPVYLNQTGTYYQNVIKQTNGLLLTGGGLDLSDPYANWYVSNARSLWNAAIESNEKGKYYPIFGICLGLELVTLLVLDGTWVWEKCPFRNVADSINFTVNPRESRLFQYADTEIVRILGEEKVTIHNHQWCLSTEAMKSSKLDKFFNITATYSDQRGSNYVAVMESHQYPFYSVMFHPERVIFEQYPSKALNKTPHTYNAIIANQYFANFFIKESRKSSNHYPDKLQFDLKLIGSKCPVFLHGKYGHSSMYYFPLDHSETDNSI